MVFSRGSKDTTVDAHIENPNEPFITQHDDVLRPRTIDLVDDTFGYMQPEGHNKGTQEDGPYFDNSGMSTVKKLVDGPSFKATSYKAYRVNGFFFCTEDSESSKITKNSGVKMKVMTNFVASARDQNPREAEIIYYGVAKEIIELDYYDFHQTVFYCDWVRVKDKVNGCTFDVEAYLTFVNLEKLMRNSKVDDEPYCLASQASQVLYCQDPTRTDWSVVIDAPKRLDKDIDAVLLIIVDEKGNEIEGECSGYLCIKYSWPGTFHTLYGDHERYDTTYFKPFPGYYFSSDGYSRDKDGYYWLTGRVEDVINVSGHRIGTT
ncbi:hypothetical protein GIB67_024159 [Kingdonia uniflora]|uniref:DUF4216 domain-containing protein n=1 Tax=Kingdonia uniflora TaxID=39325 RepID=A0A7J7LZJ9_9MAGN|nr:hypothetical protein GIB67_024159 [Kingdonia uniflora]